MAAYIDQMYKPSDADTRLRSRRAMEKAYLPLSPVDWSEYDFPEVEYFFTSYAAEMLANALQEVVDHRQCVEMDGVCDHVLKSRPESVEEENDGRWYNTMEEALKHSKKLSVNRRSKR